YLARDGTHVWLRWNAVADVERSLIYAVAVDVTEQKLLSDELGRSRDAALASSQLQARLLGLVSHEVRTPLNSVLGLASLLLESDLSDTQRADLREIRSSAARLLTLFDDVLEYSELERGVRAITTEDVDIRALVDE